MQPERVLLLACLLGLATIVAAQECGTVKFSSGLIYGGNYTKKDQYPWLCSLHDTESDEFFCGATLVSARHIVTAAHCFWGKGQSQQFHTIQNTYVFAGKYDLRYFEEHSQRRKLVEIKVHQDWKFNSEDFDADIALATMEYPVSLTGSVQPICLPTFNSVFIHPMGTVVGWGKSETSTVREPHESIPKQINVRAVTNEKCFLEYAEFAKISSYRTFCAGWPGMNVGPCHGDSGGGLYFKVHDTWYIQGIVSSTVIDKGRCDVSKYSVYTNILFLVDWIKESMKDKIYVAWTDIALQCNFTRNYDGLYGCEVEKLVIDTPNYRIANIHGKHTEGTTNLEVQYVWIKDSKVEYLPHFDANIFFPGFLKYIITGSGLKYVKRDDFAGMPKLETLNLDFNLIESMPEDSLYDLNSLVDFFIEGNFIKTFPTYLLSKAPLFQRFRASNNSLESIDADFFKSNPVLKIVTINNNKLTRIGVDFRKFKNLKRIDLGNNTCIDTNYNDWRKYKSAAIVQSEIEATCQ